MTRPRSPFWLLAALLAAAGAIFLILERPADGPAGLDPGTGSDRPTEGRPAPLHAESNDPAAGDTGTGGTGDGTATATAGFVSGIVVDERERGIPGARVQAFPIDPRGVRGAPYPDGDRLASVRTERDGTFRLPAPARAWLRVVASAPGRATVGARVAATGARIVLRLPPPSRLTLTVRTVEDRAVAQARVEVQVGDTLARGETSADGAVQFGALPPGTAWIRATADGHGTVRAGPVTLPGGGSAEAIVVLTAGVRLEGVVLDDADGKPLADARVVVARPGDGEVAPPTGADGRFGPLHAGGVDQRVFASVHAEGYAPLMESVVLHGPGTQSVVLRLQRASPWTGTVLRADGRTAAGVRVAYGDDGVAGRTPAATVTDEQGRFTLPPPPSPAPGRRVVLFARDATGTAALALRPDMLPPEPLVLTLAGGTGVTGRVVGPDGRALAGVQVRLTPAWDRIPKQPRPDAATSLVLLANETGFLELAAASAADGTWHMTGVPAAPYHVRYRWSGGQQWRDEVLEVGAASATAGTETLGAGFVLAGRVRDAAGGIVAGAEVRVVDPAAPARARRVTSNAGGDYEVRGLPAGTWRVRASIGARQAVEATVEFAADLYGADLVFEDAAALAGRVSTDDGPYDGLLSLVLLAARGGRTPRPPHHVRVRSGTFRWEGVPPGRWIVEARAPGGRRGLSAEAVEVEAGRVANARLLLAAAGGIAGTLLTPAGEPVASARVTLQTEDDDRRRLATTDARGRFGFAQLSAGRHRLDAWGRGGAPVSTAVDVVAGEQRVVEMKLAPGGTARIEVRDEKNRPLAGAVVLFRGPEGTLPALRPDRTRRDGIVLRPDLPAGDVFVVARSPEGAEGGARVLVEAGKTVEAVVRVTKRAR